MNFDFIPSKPSYKRIKEFCVEAENLLYISLAACAVSARKALEIVIGTMYSAVVDGAFPAETLNDKINDVRFKKEINNADFIKAANNVRITGNNGAHNTNPVSLNEAINAIDDLQFVVGEFFCFLGEIKEYPDFVVPKRLGVAPEELEKEENKPAVKPAVKVTDGKEEKPEPEVIAVFAERLKYVKFDITKGRDESKNKEKFILASFSDAGWPIATVKNVPFAGAVGLNIVIDTNDEVDFVMYGRDNKPLAIVEYTESSKNTFMGRKRAIAQADKLEQKFGYRPVIYYTSGYEIYCIDGLGYQPRRVFTYHSIDELELLKLRRNIRADISDPVIDDNITNRDYQKGAIKATCAAFMENRRRSLLVMATGTGKTRISIALCDVLLKANWVKNILFLADRTSLVKQAHKNYTKLLPSVTTSVYTGGSFERDPNARIIFSTYQTMIGLINDDTREFSIGRFDLIVVDEAHRSIFKKYGALFNYFDSLIVGLTATPRSEDNKSTYSLFGLPDSCPDYAYELEDAIKDKFLVGFTVTDRTTDALRRGITYDQLSDEEKEAFENTFANEEIYDFSEARITGRELVKKKYINVGTIRVMLDDLMKNGLRVCGDDKLGKSIIFARSHLEAEIIVQEFNKLYSSYLGLDFCKLIDSHVENGQNLIDRFCERDSYPQLAVSVDMLDTGIDCPDVLNLVFFKPVKSKIKFLQMVGRGTRLAPDIFGPGLDKQGFLIFDYYDNFNYFNAHNTWTTVDAQSNNNSFNSSLLLQPTTETVNKLKLDIYRYFAQRRVVPLNAFEKAYRDELRDYFIESVQNLCNDDISVEHNMAYVSKYRTAEEWSENFTNEKVDEIKKYIIPLLPKEFTDSRTRTFDIKMLHFEVTIPKQKENNKKQKVSYNSVKKMIEKLLKLKTIPAIMAKRQLLEQLLDEEYLLKYFTIEKCEKIRREIRDLMAYIEDDRQYYILDIKDNVFEGDDTTFDEPKEKSYAEKAEEYMLKGSVILSAIRNLDALTDEQKNEIDDVFKKELGTISEFSEWSGGRPLLPYLRIQVGIADEAIETKFGSFLNTNVLDEQQYEFMNQIISYAKENGDIEFKHLQTVSPFCDVDIMELFDPAKIMYIKTLINTLHRTVTE